MLVRNMLLTLFSAGFILLFAPGCSILPPGSYKPSDMYDLGAPEKKQTDGAKVSVEPLLNESACKGKFLYRIADNRLETDDCNRWANSPALMLTGFLGASLDTGSANASGKAYAVSGAVTDFELNIPAREARIGLRYVILDGETRVELDSGVLSASEKFDRERPAEQAAAMGAAAKKLASELRARIQAAPSRPAPVKK